jgi:hypothetical protein
MGGLILSPGAGKIASIIDMEDTDNEKTDI